MRRRHIYMVNKRASVKEKSLTTHRKDVFDDINKSALKLRRHVPKIVVSICFLSLCDVGCSGPTSEAEISLQEQNDLMSRALQQTQSGKADTQSCSGVLIPDSGGFNKKIALTFDDGPSTTYTGQVLNILDKHKAKAVFFINGGNIASQAHKDLLKEQVRRGHLIGNHTQNHLRSDLAPLEEFRDQVQETNEVIKSATGVAPIFFRYPYGAANCATNDVITKEFGYSYVGWHIDSADWCFANNTSGNGYCALEVFGEVPDKYRRDFVGYSLYQAQVQSGGVILFHDIHKWTAENLDALLTALEKNGYSFVRLDDTKSFPKLNALGARAKLSNQCASCDLNKNDCVKEYGKYKCIAKSTKCAYATGKNLFRQCNCNGWEWCQKNGSWSGTCESRPDIFSCKVSEVPPVITPTNISKQCAGCDLSKNDCLSDFDSFTCAPKSTTCQKAANGIMFRQCGCTGWEWCIGGKWSGYCETAESNYFTCQ